MSPCMTASNSPRPNFFASSVCDEENPRVARRGTPTRRMKLSSSTSENGVVNEPVAVPSSVEAITRYAPSCPGSMRSANSS